MYFVKSNLKFEDYKHCLEATQLENKINHLLKNKLTADDLWENLKDFIKKTWINIESTTKIQKRTT